MKNTAICPISPNTIVRLNKEQFPQRKPTRLKGYDYGTNGGYFITVCTHKKQCILSKVVTVGEGFPLPQIKLTPYGRIVDCFIKELPHRYTDITIDNYVIMPNHIHLLISVCGENGRGNPSPTIIGWLKYQATKEINGLRGTPGERVFQRSFHDHIIRGEEDYGEIWEYAEHNPQKWETDCFYTE